MFAHDNHSYPLRKLPGAKNPLSAKQIERWWTNAVSIAGTLGEVYLRSRGIEVDYTELKLLRFLPNAPYYHDDRKEPSAHYPCMVAAIADLDGNLTGVHRTYLAPDGRGKAPEAKPKKALGAAAHGMRLSARSTVVRIAEGIETIISIATAKGLGEAQYVAVSAGMLAKWEIPPWCEELEIYADNDKAGTGQKAAGELALRAKGAGMAVRIFTPAEVKDFNDLLRTGGAEAVRAVEGVEPADPAGEGGAGATDEPDPEIARLAAMPTLEYEKQRKEEARRLGVRATALDKVVAQARKALTVQTASNIRSGSGQTHDREEVGDRSNTCSNTSPFETDEELAARLAQTVEELYSAARELIESPDVLVKVEDAVGKLGYAGNRKPVLMVYIALTSRLLDKPINVHVMAPSAAGKNYTVNTALELVPEQAVFKMTTSTPKALIYNSEDLQHKTVVLAECDSILKLEGNAATLVRSIIEDARTDYDTVEKDPETNHFVVRRVTKQGPTGLITTGVRELEFQTSTRVLNVHLPDTPEQTKEILKAQAAVASGQAASGPAEWTAQFQDFQRWLAVQPPRPVVVPFAPVLAEKIPADETRTRRDFKQLLSVIQTIALINQHHREVDRAGRIVADLADYGWTRTLLLSSFKSIAAGGITDAIRQTVAAVPEGEKVSEADLARALKLSKSTVHYRVNRALRGGWLQNLETRKGYPARLMRGEPLPEDTSPLPTVQELETALAGFEHPPYSNGYSNSPQTLGGVGQTASPFECSNGSNEADTRALNGALGKAWRQEEQAAEQRHEPVQVAAETLKAIVAERYAASDPVTETDAVNILCAAGLTRDSARHVCDDLAVGVAALWLKVPGPHGGWILVPRPAVPDPPTEDDRRADPDLEIISEAEIGRQAAADADGGGAATNPAPTLAAEGESNSAEGDGPASVPDDALAGFDLAVFDSMSLFNRERTIAHYAACTGVAPDKIVKCIEAKRQTRERFEM